MRRTPLPRPLPGVPGRGRPPPRGARMVNGVPSDSLTPVRRGEGRERGHRATADDMKITRIETLILPEHPNGFWLRVHTSEGLFGTGETFYLPTAVEAVVHDFAAP